MPGADDPFEAARRHGAPLLRRLLGLGHDLFSGGEAPYGTFYNVNFPPVGAADVAGVRVAAQGVRPGVHFGVEPHLSPSGRRFLWIKGGRQDVASGPGTDAEVNLAGYISVTPMRCDLTAHDLLPLLGEALA